MAPFWKQFTAWGIASGDSLIQSTERKLVFSYAMAVLVVLVIFVFIQRRGGGLGLNEVIATVVVGAISCLFFYFVSNRILHHVREEVRSHNQYLSDASHELRTPLTVMKTDLQIALRHPGNADELKDVMQGTLDEVDRMHKIVEDLLMLSRNYLLRKGEEQYQTDLVPLLKDTVSKLESYARTKHVHIKLEGMPKEAVELRGDRRKLLQALLNVVKNAIEFSKPEGGTVRIIIEKLSDKEVEVAVQDQGIGISSHDLPHIFKRFYQVDKSRAWREAGGSGLGLSIARWIVQGYGGELSAESKLGKGTKMIFTLARPTS